MTRSMSAGAVLIAGLAAGSAFGQKTINAAGATFPYPIYSKWFSEYSKAKGVQINYQSIGSGGGISQLIAGTVDFGASDRAMSDQEVGKLKSKTLYFATVMGAIVPTYNVSGVSTALKFTGPVIADIFLGKITKWDDPALKAINPGVKLPSSDITVVHRSDGSGTSFVFTTYLSKVSPDWKSKIGPNQSPNWTVGLGAKGNEGVAGLVKQTPNSIGYVELNYAKQNKMDFGLVKNASGAFLKADLAGVTAAASAVKMVPADITDEKGATAYPISSFTYLLIPTQFSDSAKAEGVKGFLNWMLTQGQNEVEALDYAKLPSSVVAQEQKQIAEIK